MRKKDRSDFQFIVYIAMCIAIIIFSLQPWAKLPEYYIGSLPSSVASSEEDIIKSIEDIILADGNVATLNIDEVLLKEDSTLSQRRISPNSMVE